jgi:hypothetical protein
MLMQLSVLGIPIVGLLFDGLSRMINYLIKSIPRRGLAAVLEAYLVIKVGTLFILSAQPALVVSGNFDLLISRFAFAPLLSMPRLRIYLKAERYSVEAK